MKGTSSQVEGRFEDATTDILNADEGEASAIYRSAVGTIAESARLADSCIL